jgi:RNA polymerase sigma-70 factor (ECF subfamily)
MLPGGRESSTNKPTAVDLDHWMERYQQADSDATRVLIRALSPALLQFLEQSDDLLQETWLRIHRVRHTYRPGEPVLPWVYTIARRVRIDSYRQTRRITDHEIAMVSLPEVASSDESYGRAPDFETLVSALPESQRDVVTMLKVGGLSLEEVARATSCSVGSVKQKAHRAYERLRTVLSVGAHHGVEEIHELP